MELDSSDLLIFKMRKKIEPKEGKPITKEEAKPTIKQEPKGNQQNRVPNPTIIQRLMIKQDQTAAEPVLMGPKEQKHEPSRPIPKISAVEKMEDTTTKAVPRITPTKTVEKENPDNIKEMYCTSHPWRQAYSQCTICGLPYCYADLMKYDGKFYCLADIDRAEMRTGQKTVAQRKNVFLYIASVLFLLNSGILGYLLYPQVSYLIAYLEQANFHSLGSTISNLNYSYYISIADSLMILFCLVSAFAIFSRSNRGIFFSAFVAALSFIFLSYEYFTSGYDLLLPSTFISLISITVISFSRMSSIRSVAEESIGIPDVEWPATERF